jgi:hypothetical protein
MVAACANKLRPGGKRSLVWFGYGALIIARLMVRRNPAGISK